MDEETFRQFITYDEGSDSEKENESTRQPKTTQNQFYLIANFMECNKEEFNDKKKIGELWDDLAENLNGIGPPSHSVDEWKKIWSSHKYYKNRKRLSNVSLHNDKPDKSSHLGQSGQSSQAAVFVEQVAGAAETNERVSIQSEFLNKLDVVIANQNTMIANQVVIVNEMKNLVQEVAKKV